MDTIDIRRASIAHKTKWAIALLVAVLISPVIFLAIKGIVGLAIAALIGVGLINLAPVVGMKFANWKLKGLKSEARENPIETRQNIAIQARERIKAAEAELTNFSAEVRGFADEVKSLKQAQPEDAADFDQQLDGLKRLLTLKQDGLQAARRSADEFEQATARAARKWKVAQSALRMQKLAGAAADNALNKILADESLDAVQTAMNRALSELDTAIAMSAPPAIAHRPTTVIDTTAVEVRERFRA